MSKKKRSPYFLCEKILNESLPVVTDRQTDRRTDTISACRLSTLPRERIKCRVVEGLVRPTVAY